MQHLYPRVNHFSRLSTAPRKWRLEFASGRTLGRRPPRRVRSVPGNSSPLFWGRVLNFALLFCGWLLLAAASSTLAQSGYSIKEHYAKREVTIPMRDGTRLFTSLYVPKDRSRSYPIMLSRTNYRIAPYGLEAYKTSLGPSGKFAEEGFIFAYQNVRGRLMSEGQYLNMRPESAEKRRAPYVDESTDAYDTIDWLVKCVPNNNGRVGMWGISYPGFYTACGVINSHPALKAASPQAPIADWFLGDDFHHNGALFLLDSFDFAYNTPDVYRFFLDLGPLRHAGEKYPRDALWDDMMQHDTYDSFWQARNLLPQLKNVRAAVLTVGGWFDAEDMYGPLKIYKAIEKANPGIVNTLVMGPWPHVGWAATQGEKFGDISFGMPTSEYFRDEIQFPFFLYYLKDKGKPHQPEAQVFETGANKWLSFDAWPPKNLTPKALYLQADKKLSFDPPKEPRPDSSDEYVSDPANPVPYTPEKLSRRKDDYMIGDQRFAAARPDVLTYQTDPLTENVTLAGPIHPELFVSTTGTDADFVVKLIDVFPDDAPEADGVKWGGYQMLVRGDVMRGKFRNSYVKPESFAPGQVTPVKYELRDVCHAFKKGHRIMVQVQSSWFPLVDRNPQKFTNINTAGESDFQKATIHVYHSGTYPSHLRVGVLRE